MKQKRNKIMVRWSNYVECIARNVVKTGGLLDGGNQSARNFPYLRLSHLHLNMVMQLKHFKKWKSAPFRVLPYCELEELEETPDQGTLSYVMAPCRLGISLAELYS